jgi:hypothetical protein
MMGAQFEIRIDGTPRSYRDRKDYPMEDARLIKSKNPHSIAGLAWRQPEEGAVIMFGLGSRRPKRSPLAGS